MKRDDKRIVMASIDGLMELLTEVVKEARKLGADDMWMLNYVMAELPHVFRKEADYVPMQSVRADVRLP